MGLVFNFKYYSGVTDGIGPRFSTERYRGSTLTRDIWKVINDGGDSTPYIKKAKMLYSVSRQPEVLWAQRSDRIYLTISIPDAKYVNVKADPSGLFNFSATGPHGEPFSFSLEFFDSIKPEVGKLKTGLRTITCSVYKEKTSWWSRLLKSKEKPAPYIKVDWNKWCDEDDESELSSEDDNDGVNDEDESSDDGMLYLPDLEKARRKY